MLASYFDRFVRPRAIRAAAMTIVAFATAAPNVAGAAAAPLAGRIVDAQTGAPISGALVAITNSLLDSAPSANDATFAQTDATGNFVLVGRAAPTSDFYLHVFPSDGHATLRRLETPAGAATDLAQVGLTMPSADERGWLALLNAERAEGGLGPLHFEDAALRAARTWSAYQAEHGRLEHEAQGAVGPNGFPLATPSDRYRYFDGVGLGSISGLSENIAMLSYGSYKDAQELFYAERALCPGRSATGCPFTPSTGHYVNLMDPNARYVGVGEAASSRGRFYDEVIVDASLPQG